MITTDACLILFQLKLYSNSKCLLVLVRARNKVHIAVYNQDFNINSPVRLMRQLDERHSCLLFTVYSLLFTLHHPQFTPADDHLNSDSAVANLNDVQQFHHLSLKMGIQQTFAFPKSSVCEFQTAAFPETDNAISPLDPVQRCLCQG